MKQRQYLKDYRPSAFAVPRIHLRLDIRDSYVEIHSRLDIERRAGEEQDLRLDGREMDLRELRIDGQALTAEGYAADADGLTVKDVPERCVLDVVVRIDPYSNSSLEGLYYAGDMLCTQCESHGFSRITYCLDRPDVLSVYSVELEADPLSYPVLLANGELSEREELDDGRVRVRWDDPHPKPCYLFAAVAGDLASRSCDYTTSEGRRVQVGFYCDHGIEDQLDHAMDSLLRSMRWDEQRYGLAYDLDTYNVVVAAAFNMGAMENKGLNIFNPKYVLASPDTATDTDYANVEAVIAHEYFHNWTGNRVTCRDWFQLSLKEGLTVFRDQQFSADSGAGPVQRIDQVRMLRGRQFAEDAGPLAHPVRPDSYLEMNNFYTLTVYEKGAELVRLLHSRLGEEGFRRGMDLYFQRHDGQAVTIEDFLAAHGDANDIDTDGILRWYGQAGTPLVAIDDEYRDGVYHLHCRQSIPTNPDAVPVLIPIRMRLLSADGKTLLEPRVLEFAAAEQSWSFEMPEEPVPVLFEGLSAPVQWQYAYSQQQLNSILAHASDPFSRWEAAQRLFLQQIDAEYAGASEPADWDPFRSLLEDSADPAVIAALLRPPQADELLERYDNLDPVRLCQAVDKIESALARALAGHLPDAVESTRESSGYRFEPQAAARRTLHARLLQLWVKAGDPAGVAHAQAVFAAADNLSDRMLALNAINHRPSEARSDMLEAFRQRYREDRLVFDRWFALQAQLPGEAGLEAVQSLVEDPDFDPLNPNRVRAVMSSFGMLNPSALYAADGAGLELMAEQVLRFDGINPQLAARLVAPGAIRHKLAEPYQARMTAAMRRIQAQARSADVLEQVERILADA